MLSENYSSNDRLPQEGHGVPVTPPSSPVSTASVRSLSPTLLANVNPNPPPYSFIHEESQWNGLLQYFSQGRATGRQVEDYMPFTAIAPCYLPPDLRTSAWVLEQMRGSLPSEVLKLGPGSAICLQDISLSDAFYAPAAPTLFGVIDRMQWREDGYQIATVSTHIYSPSGYSVEDAHFCFVAIPTHFIDPIFHITRITPYNTIGQMSIAVDQAYPPRRVWEGNGQGLRSLEMGSLHVEDRHQAVREWVDEQHMLGWF